MIVAGFSSNQAGAVETSFLMCQSCPAGTYSAGGTSKSCTPCPKGQYQDLGGQSSCKACPAGTYSSAGASSCTSCPVGQYQNETGASSCKACNANTYEGPSCGSNKKYAVEYCTTTGSTSATANSSKTFVGNVSFGCSSGYTCSGGSCVKDTPTEQCPRGSFVSFTECYQSLSNGNGSYTDYGKYPYYKYKNGRCEFDHYGPCTRR